MLTAGTAEKKQKYCRGCKEFHFAEFPAAFSRNRAGIIKRISSSCEFYCSFTVLHHFNPPWSYKSDSLVLLRVSAAPTASFNQRFLFTGNNQSLAGEGDDSGNSCTIGSEIYLDVSYLHYLYDARLQISSCLQACKVWSALYDGEDPPPEKYQPGVLEEPGLKTRHAQMALKRVSQPPGSHPHPRQLPAAEPPSVQQLDLEWDDSYDACPVQTAHEESKPPPQPRPDPPKHIQEMRKTAIMLVKGSYVEENEFQDDVMVYDLVAKKDSRDGGLIKSNKAESENTQTGSAGVPLKNGLSLNLPTSLMADHSKTSLDSKVKGQTDCNSNLQKSTAAGIGEDLLAQYEELIRTLDTEAGAKPVKSGGESKKAVVPREEEVAEEEAAEEVEEMDFTSFTAETPEPEKVHSPFGKFFGGNAGRSHSVPFTGELKEELLL